MYEHTHHAVLLTLLLVGVFVGAMVLVALAADEMPPGVLVIVSVVAIVLLVAIFLFRKLTIRVDAEAVSLGFGPGWPGKRIPLAEIEAAEVAYQPWYWGWGIRWTPRGWLWRVAGLRCVELRRRSGRSFFVGTDDPEGLVRAIDEASA
jgi:hypothetical protein